MSEKKLTTFALGSIYLYQTFTECVSNQYTFWYNYMPDVTASYGTPFVLLRLFGYFHTLLLCIDIRCLDRSILTKLLLIVYLINTHILIYQSAKCDCRLRNVILFYFTLFFANFAHNRWIFMSEMLYFHHINCVFNEYEHFGLNRRKSEGWKGYKKYGRKAHKVTKVQSAYW